MKFRNFFKDWDDCFWYKIDRILFRVVFVDWHVDGQVHVLFHILQFEVWEVKSEMLRWHLKEWRWKFDDDQFDLIPYPFVRDPNQHRADEYYSPYLNHDNTLRFTPKLSNKGRVKFFKVIYLVNVKLPTQLIFIFGRQYRHWKNNYRNNYHIKTVSLYWTRLWFYKISHQKNKIRRSWKNS